jgi:hypothetical protein
MTKSIEILVPVLVVCALAVCGLEVGSHARENGRQLLERSFYSIEAPQALPELRPGDIQVKGARDGDRINLQILVGQLNVEEVQIAAVKLFSEPSGDFIMALFDEKADANSITKYWLENGLSPQISATCNFDTGVFPTVNTVAPQEKDHEFHIELTLAYKDGYDEEGLAYISPQKGERFMFGATFNPFDKACTEITCGGQFCSRCCKPGQQVQCCCTFENCWCGCWPMGC